jgi:hypothetical protein
MKVAIEYSGHLRFIQETYENMKEHLTANEEIEFFVFCHTWDESKEEDIDYLLNIIKPKRYLIETQKKFEKNPYLLINSDITHDDYLNDPLRIEHNELYPHDYKPFFEKPSSENNFTFYKDSQVVKIGYYCHYPYNTNSLFYSIHQSNALMKSWAQENNIVFDFVIRLRSDMVFTSPIYLHELDKNKITVFEAEPHKGEMGKYTIHDQFGIGNMKNMNIYTDVYVYLPCYYFIFKLDFVSELFLGFHLMHNNIPIHKIPRNYYLLRYKDRNPHTRPTC